MSVPTGDPHGPVLWRKQDWAYEEVREMIMSNRLAPGAAIDQEVLAAQLGISRIPLRQGLGRLIAEGLVKDNPHRQWEVTELSAGDVRDIYSGREVLETMLAEAGVSGIAEAGLAAMRQALDDQEGLLAAGRDSAFDTAEFRSADRAFHGTLYAAAHMPISESALAQLLTMSERYVRQYQSDIDRARASVDEHRAILGAVRAGDVATTVALVREHIRRGRILLERAAGGRS